MMQFATVFPENSIVVSLIRQLELEYSSGWGEKQLRHCLPFAEVITDEQIVYALRRQLSWTHLTIGYFKYPNNTNSHSVILH